MATEETLTESISCDIYKTLGTGTPSIWMSSTAAMQLSCNKDAYFLVLIWVQTENRMRLRPKRTFHITVFRVIMRLPFFVDCVLWSKGHWLWFRLHFLWSWTQRLKCRGNQHWKNTKKTPNSWSSSCLQVWPKKKMSHWIIDVGCFVRQGLKELLI